MYADTNCCQNKFRGLCTYSLCGAMCCRVLLFFARTRTQTYARAHAHTHTNTPTHPHTNTHTNTYTHSRFNQHSGWHFRYSREWQRPGGCLPSLKIRCVIEYILYHIKNIFILYHIHTYIYVYI